MIESDPLADMLGNISYVSCRIPLDNLMLAVVDSLQFCLHQSLAIAQAEKQASLGSLCGVKDDWELVVYESRCGRQLISPFKVGLRP